MSVVCLDKDVSLAQSVATLMGCECILPEQHEFPDGEHYLRLDTHVLNEDIFLFSNLHQPDKKILPLIFSAGFLREIGAKRIVLVTPYLPYMRQDTQFHPGEYVTSRYFSKLISEHFDGLITIDPHLHRYHHLDDIYSIPSTVIHATSVIAEWIKTTISNPIIIGPDDESRQWAEDVAALADCAVTVLRKTRLGDRDVRIHMEQNDLYKNHQPILVDDIISTGKTVLETARLMVKEGYQKPLVIGVHAVLAEGAANELNRAIEQDLLANWLTCNTIAHPSNGIDVSVLLETAIQNFWA